MMRIWSTVALVVSVTAAGPVLVVGQRPAERPRITGIGHVAFRVADAAAARTFYGELLGLVSQVPATGATLAYAVGARQSIVLEPGLPAGEDERLSHVAFETTDVKALAAGLRSRGVEVRQPEDRCSADAIRVTDPDGHTVEFVQVSWPPAAGGAGAPSAVSDRLLHAGLIVADEGRAHTFYRDALAFLEIWRGGRDDGMTRWVNMRVPDGTDYLEYMLEAAAAPTRQQRGVLHHLCLRVPDMQAAWEEVARRSVALRRALPSPPQIGRNGRYQLNLYDADGTRVELMEPFTVR